MLALKQLTYYNLDHQLINSLSWEIPAGCVFHIQAGNGVGKTTLLQLICGLKLPNQGDIVYQGESIKANLAAYQAKIHYIGHELSIHNQFSIREHWTFEQVDADRLEKAIGYFNLGGVADKPVAQLSYGQRKQALLMRLLLIDKPLWVLDEPLVGLDQNSIALLVKTMTQHTQQQGSVIMTSHQALPVELDNLMAVHL